MNATESTSEPQPNRGGLAPEDRQCRYVLGHGRHCQSWAIRGHEYCHRHLRWDDTRHDGPITVPLVEDASAIQLVASQAIRALAWGHIPPDNGRAILYGCRLMQNAQAQQLAEAKFRLHCHQLGLNPNLFLPNADSGCPIACPERAAGESNGSPAVGDVGERDSAPVSDATTPAQPAHEAQQSSDPVIPSEARSANAVILSEARTANAVILSEARSAESKDLHSSPDETAELTHLSAAADDPTPYPLPPVPCRHPLDDIPPAPIPQSVCEPCVAALAQGADESLLGCKVCPASKAGNLRAPRLPDPRNPPETPHEPTPIPPIGQAAFRDLKTKWEDALDRLGHTRADVRFPRYCEPREDFRAARRQRPFADFLHHYPTAPPPPIPTKPAAPLLATPAEESQSQR